MRTIEIFGLLLLALVIGKLWWRWTSRRRPLPCPSWLAWTLESPLMDRLIGTQMTLDRIGLRPGQRVWKSVPDQGVCSFLPRDASCLAEKSSDWTFNLECSND